MSCPRRLHLALLSLLAALASLAAAVTVLAGPATAAAAPRRWGGMVLNAVQHRNGTIHVVGFAVDYAHPYRRIFGCVAVGGHCVRGIRAGAGSAWFDRTHHVPGHHRVDVQLGREPVGAVVTLETNQPDGSHRLGSRRASTPGERIVAQARRYVGRVPYVWGGSTPASGFDCSGYVMWSYRHAGVANLPHNAEAQRHVPFMHQIARSQARPGDLIFYLSGGSAYHVAMYGGHNMQYSATDPAQGIQFQRIWAHNIIFATDWH